MLPNINENLYAEFKSTGYRIKKFKKQPVERVPDVVNLAYIDVCRTMKGVVPAQRGAFKQIGISLVKRLLTAPPTNQTEFDYLHHHSCQEAVKLSDSQAAHIHYGHAQKLLNMSLKYLYNEFAIYRDISNVFGFPDNIEVLFHLPVDRQTREYLVHRCSFREPTTLPWSKWGSEEYLSFQAQVRDRFAGKYAPLELDYIIWKSEGKSPRQRLGPCSLA